MAAGSSRDIFGKFWHILWFFLSPLNTLFIYRKCKHFMWLLFDICGEVPAAGWLLPGGEVGEDVVVGVVGVLAHLVVPDNVLHQYTRIQLGLSCILYSWIFQSWALATIFATSRQCDNVARSIYCISHFVKEYVHSKLKCVWAETLVILTKFYYITITLHISLNITFFLSCKVVKKMCQETVLFYSHFFMLQSNLIWAHAYSYIWLLLRYKSTIRIIVLQV